MKPLIAILTGCLVFCFSGASLSQDFTVSDQDGNLLLQVTDEGQAGAIVLPPLGSPLADTADKLCNLSGVLRWKDAQLGQGWNRTGNAVHLATGTDGVGIGTTAPTDGAKLEVAGTVRIADGTQGPGKQLVSDSEGRASWREMSRSQAAFVGGELTFPVTQNYGSYDNPKYIEMTVPAAGKIIVSATGGVSFEGAGHDIVLIGLLADWEGQPDTDWSAENTWYHHLMVVTDCDCPDKAGNCSASWNNLRGFDVGSAGTYRFNLWANKYNLSSTVVLHDINMSAEYYPN